uniref:Uncharacterized protein n=1 Tax=Chaetoceros debilis TaxID=122233 RepID=A0A7S3QC54_9STRA
MDIHLEVPSAKPSVNPSLMPSVQPSVCRDEFEWRVGGSSIYKGMTCEDIDYDPVKWCAFLQKIPDASYGGKSISEACCECGGGDHQTIFPSLSPSASPSLTSSPSFVVVPSESPSTCSDEPGWTFTADDEELNLGCDALQENLCSVVEHIIFGLKTASAACCVCGGGDHVVIPCYNAPNWIVNGTSPYKNLGCSDIDEIDPDLRDNLCGLLLGVYDEDYESMPVSEACCACGGGQGDNITHYLVGGGDIEEKEPECINEPGWFYATTQNGVKMGCDAIAANPDELCAVAESVDTLGKRKPASLACCVCGGGIHQTMAPSSVPSSVPSLNPSLSPSECIDEPEWFFAIENGVKLGCTSLVQNPENENLCAAAELVELDSKPASLACCVCGGGTSKQ